MRRLAGSWIFLLVMILLDIYVFQGLRVITASASPKARFISHLVYWIISGTAIALVILTPFLQVEQWPRALRNYVFAIIIGLFLAKMIAATFFLVDDVRRLVQWTGGKLYYQVLQGETYTGSHISRSTFLSWLGMALGGGLFTSLLYGFSNKYRYQLEKVTLSFDHLPPAFRGLKIVQISDVHSGSFTDRKAVEKGIQMILDQKPDVIFFTGDLVNDHADEMREYKEVFARLQAPLGVYSTLGNHDYGDYRQWSTEEEKKANLEKLKNIHREMGWRLLMNEHVALEREGQKIGVLGVENWSAKGNFKRYGKMDQAHAGSEQYPFKILLSHDPSHWESEILSVYRDVDLMLSGHTHGMQFGVEIPGFRWSPVQYMYKQWAGLYTQGRQHLYVNRGFGFIGYPGRVGMLPEITLIELA